MDADTSQNSYVILLSYTCYFLKFKVFKIIIIIIGISIAPYPRAHGALQRNLGDVAAVVRSSTISPLNNRTNKRNKERGVKTIELLHIAVQ